MKAKATTFGAISIVNAIAGGKGATASVRLTTEATVELAEGPGEWNMTINGRRADSKLTLETVRRSLKEAGKDPNAYSGRVETTSRVPIGVGLKTSSASSAAVSMAVHGALGRRAFDPLRVLNCSVEASLASGASITGALDDVASCVLGGMNLTDNIARKVLSSKLFPKPLKVLIRVPKEESARGSMDLEFVRKFGNLTDHFFRMALEGDQWRAMILNGLTYSSMLKYDPLPALRAVELGATGAGLSGTGPAVAAVFDRSKAAELEAVREVWAADGATVIETETNNEHARLEVVE